MQVRLIKEPITTYCRKLPWADKAANPSLWEIGATYEASYGKHFFGSPSAVVFTDDIYDDLLDASCFEPVDDEARAFYTSPAFIA